MTNMSVVKFMAEYYHDDACQAVLNGNGKIVKEGIGWFRIETTNSRGWKNLFAYEQSCDDGNVWIKDEIKG